MLCMYRCGLLLQTEQRGLSVSLSVGPSVTVVMPAKTAEPSEMVLNGPKESCIRWVPTVA